MKYRWDGLDKLVKLVNAFNDETNTRKLGKMVAFTLWDENRMAVLEGRDVFERPMPPLQYRQGIGQPYGSVRPTPRTGNLPPYNPIVSNLKIEQYQKMVGPRLAPRHEDSRIIRNFLVRPTFVGKKTIIVQGEWMNVVDKQGRPILPTHFRGGRTPIGWNVPSYPMGGIRDRTMQEILGDIDDWARDIVTRSGL